MPQGNYQPWLYEDPKIVISPAVATAALINIGDMVQLTGGAVIGAGDHVWNTNLATTQGEFHTIFLGVSLDRSRNGDILPVRVATSGVFQFACAAATFEIGDLVGPAKQTGNLLDPQTVVAVGAANLSIGRVQTRGTSITQVRVSVASSVLWGGVNVVA